MYRVSIELYKHEWKFGRTRNAVETRAAGECFQSFFEFLNRNVFDLQDIECARNFISMRVHQNSFWNRGKSNLEMTYWFGTPLFYYYWNKYMTVVTSRKTFYNFK